MEDTTTTTTETTNVTSQVQEVPEDTTTTTTAKATRRARRGSVTFDGDSKSEEFSQDKEAADRLEAAKQLGVTNGKADKEAVSK